MNKKSNPHYQLISSKRLVVGIYFKMPLNATIFSFYSKQSGVERVYIVEMYRLYMFLPYAVYQVAHSYYAYDDKEHKQMGV